MSIIQTHISQIVLLEYKLYFCFLCVRSECLNSTSRSDRNCDVSTAVLCSLNTTSIVNECYGPSPPAGYACWDGGPAGNLLFYVAPNMTQFSRHLSELVVTREVMSGNRQKANFEQGPTERCTVCHTMYPQCDTCSKYGRRGVHSLDQDKFRNAHDNPSFTDDSGAQQSHWMKKIEKVSAHHILHFYR